MDFTIAFADPETEIVDYQQSSDGKTLTVRGQASHLKSINCVRVGLQHPVTHKYWDGTKWCKEFCHHRTEDPDRSEVRLKHRNWKLSIAMPESESVTLVARAYSPSSQYDHTPAVKTIELRSGVPVVSVSQSLTENAR